jgi:hypothetical protein
MSKVSQRFKANTVCTKKLPAGSKENLALLLFCSPCPRQKRIAKAWQKHGKKHGKSMAGRRAAEEKLRGCVKIVSIHLQKFCKVCCKEVRICLNNV